KLFLWFPIPHTLTKVISHLQDFQLEYETMQQSGLSLLCESGQAQEIVRNLAQLLTSVEISETKVLFLESGIQPQIQDFGSVTYLERFIKYSESGWLVEMLTAARITSHFQPIVSIQDTSQIYGYESLLRGIDAQGNLVSPGAILDVATDSGLLPQVDRAARLSAIAQASKHQIQERIFINFAPTAVYDPVFCLRTTVEAIQQANITPDRIVFEVVESNHPQDLSHLKNVLHYYRDAGFLVALDDLGSGYSSLNLLHQLRPDFLKLDMELTRNVHQDTYKALITEKILEIAHQLEIKTVAEGIECLEELHWLQQRGATFAQGYLIAKPSEIPVINTSSLALL
ncbi:MAG TPA: EAL domain-containing protein, partial [Xenococcaceae cyanobacterium]